MNTVISLDPFALRAFQKGGPFEGQDPQVFLDTVAQKHLQLVDGYAPFCKHIFLPNFTETVVPMCVPLTDDNKALIETDYIARRDSELPVLTRWIPRAKLPNLPPAKYLDLILYSHEQLKLEAEAMGEQMGQQMWPTDCTKDIAQCYAIISIKPQNYDFELPMQPITMLRNCIISEGGSGVPIDREKYKKSVEFWRYNVELR